MGGLLPATRAALLAATGFLVHGGPSASRGFLTGRAALLIAFLDVFGLALLLAAVLGFASAWHESLQSFEGRIMLQITC